MVPWFSLFTLEGAKTKPWPTQTWQGCNLLNEPTLFQITESFTERDTGGPLCLHIGGTKGELKKFH